MFDIEKNIIPLIDNAKSSIISSVDQDGFPNSKAMLPARKRIGVQKLYFTTNTSSMRVEQYKANPKSCVYFFNNSKFQGVMLKGCITVLEDVASKEMVWRSGDEMYYPKGVTDPDYCVLMCTTTEGRYYSNFSSHTFTIGA
ncbi:MAG: pyridoxamine 5'-phosphate oxidase family protein [Fibrobacter sp.]|nr:pyridoxamine 5'-phosphate oxidase family protein [Fibrobacter sp.]